jgi:hypothetical protein
MDNRPALSMSAALLAASALLAPSQLHAADPDPFVSVDRPPYGPGDRDVQLSIQLGSGDTSQNTEIWVLYSKDKGVLQGALVGSPVPQGKAKIELTDAGGVVKASFIYPHGDAPQPNVVDRNPAALPAGTRVYQKVIKKRGSIQVASSVLEFRMPDRLTIANIGDSYASGEGAPYSSGNKWDYELCHRSNNSGQSRAVKAFRQAHPEVSIAYRNVACSGAEIDDGLLQSQDKLGPFADTNGKTVKPQLDQLETWLKDNGFEQLNIALLSIGGNDVGFAPYVKDYFILPNNLMDADHAPARSVIATHIRERIPAGYAELKEQLDARFDYDHVLVTAYPDPTRWKNAQFCGAPEAYGKCWGVVESLASPQTEFRFASEAVVGKLNSTIRSTIDSFKKWGFLSDSADAARTHGICNCDSPYYNTVGSSMLGQGDPWGTMHLTRTGHKQVYQPVVSAGLEKAFTALQRKYKMEQAKELAVQKLNEAKQRAEARAKLAALVRKTPQRLTSSDAIPKELLEKATLNAVKPADTGDDNRLPDDDGK